VRAMLRWILGFMAFWGDILKRTVRLLLGLYKRADLLGGFLTWLGLGVVAWLQLIPLRVWLIVGGVLILYAIMAAIYEKFREIEADKEELEKRVATEKRREGLRAVLVEASKDGQKLFYSNSSETEVETWGNAVYVIVQAALGKSEADYIFVNSDFQTSLPPHGSPHRIWLRYRLEKLQELIGRVDSLNNINPDFNGYDYIVPD
jgi:hypothetical protein